MNKAAIITIYSRLNYGNRLQNYAVQEVLKELNIEPFTIKNISKFGMFRKKIDKSFKIGEQITTKNNIYQLKRDLFEIFNTPFLTNVSIYSWISGSTSLTFFISFPNLSL